MKKLFLLALACVSLHAQNFANFPAFKPWVLNWDHEAPPNLFTFDLFNGANKITTLSTNEFVLAGVTNGVATYRATVPPILAGLNILTIVAFSGTNASAPSLPLTALGEIPPPKNLRP